MEIQLIVFALACPTSYCTHWNSFSFFRLTCNLFGVQLISSKFHIVRSFWGKNGQRTFYFKFKDCTLVSQRTFHPKCAFNRINIIATTIEDKSAIRTGNVHSRHELQLEKSRYTSSLISLQIQVWQNRVTRLSYTYTRARTKRDKRKPWERWREGRREEGEHTRVAIVKRSEIET